ncbi:CLUMA_CG000289, isoform A [Clunio marinus]|uniref:CLUMA_CG000289, isoform A n=1 Tax=Clunio marinus TaxID=568069 RepID=A0A1J1HJL3_9DIPT|nr:CLUMA_CG000289, isoform A [Clunio marinus]
MKIIKIIERRRVEEWKTTRRDRHFEISEVTKIMKVMIMKMGKEKLINIIYEMLFDVVLQQQEYDKINWNFISYCQIVYGQNRLSYIEC